ncbi:Transcriptional regulatory protein YehT [compost metagenome]
MTIKVLLIDDQEVNIDLLRNLLKKFFSSIEIIGISTDPLEALSLAHTLQPDLLFLDIQMPGLNGLDLMKEVKKAADTEVIFVTAFSEYALDAYENQAAGYITKPVNAEKFVLTVSKVLDQIETRKKLTLPEPDELFRNNGKIALSTQKGLIFLDPDTIYYCESGGNYTTFFLKEEKQVVVSKQIGQFEQLLLKKQFVRIHDRYIINLKHLRAYHRGNGGTVILENDKELPVSVRRKENLLKFFE